MTGNPRLAEISAEIDQLEDGADLCQECDSTYDALADKRDELEAMLSRWEPCQACRKVRAAEHARISALVAEWETLTGRSAGGI